jgi:hypothetical protein
MYSNFVSKETVDVNKRKVMNTCISLKFSNTQQKLRIG